MSLNKLIIGLTLALSVVGCSEKKTLNLCDLAYPEISEQCNLVIKKKEGRKVYCGCSDEKLNDLFGCFYVRTKEHDIYFCGDQ